MATISLKAVDYKRLSLVKSGAGIFDVAHAYVKLDDWLKIADQIPEDINPRYHNADSALCSKGAVFNGIMNTLIEDPDKGFLIVD